MLSSDPAHEIDQIAPGESQSVFINLGESFGGGLVEIPCHVTRGKEEGPTVMVTAAIHGDEINGTGAIRKIIREQEITITRGKLILVPVVNMFGFERHSRYLPDRRDLNRSFPGSPKGSLASRVAHSFFSTLVKQVDFCIDLHTAAVRRTNFPNVRANLKDKQTRQLAFSTQAELILHCKGPKGSFRREACRANCPTIVIEAGEVWKVEPGIAEFLVRCVQGVLTHLDMTPASQTQEIQPTVIANTKWIRADHGGFLDFHVTPGEIIERDQPIATNANLLGFEQSTLRSPYDAIVLGMTTVPSVSPGDAVCHLGRIRKQVADDLSDQRETDAGDLSERIRNELSTGILVTDRDPDEVPEDGVQ